MGAQVVAVHITQCFCPPARSKLRAANPPSVIPHVSAKDKQVSPLFAAVAESCETLWRAAMVPAAINWVIKPGTMIDARPIVAIADRRDGIHGQCSQAR
jgi:hypothetical protein